MGVPYGGLPQHMAEHGGTKPAGFASRHISLTARSPATHPNRHPTSLPVPDMRVSISHHDVRKGFLFKRTFYAVDLAVAFTHEETQIISMRRLADTKLLDRRPATARVDDRDERFELRLRDLINGRTDRFLCATPSAAKIYEDDLLRVMAQVKLWVGDNAESGGRTVVEF